MIRIQKVESEGSGDYHADNGSHFGAYQIAYSNWDHWCEMYLSDGGRTPHQLELTWLKDRTEPYNLGDNEVHLAFGTDDFDGAHARHAKMGCICYENAAMGIYFIVDPDGYWLEILPA